MVSTLDDVDGDCDATMADYYVEVVIDFHISTTFIIGSLQLPHAWSFPYADAIAKWLIILIIQCTFRVHLAW